ncbi:MIP transporter [Xylogone sp. PMI_703]|nr:MIP transporter [Xylogone sp. PMI_703]
MSLNEKGISPGRESIDPESQNHNYHATRRRSFASHPFSNRIAKTQDREVDTSCPQNANILKSIPDTPAAHLHWRQSLDLHGFLDPNLWRRATIEAVGSMMLDFVSMWIGTYPASLAPQTTLPISGVYGTPQFLGPLVAGITNLLLLMLFIYTTGTFSGAHLNPSITMAMFFARLITLPCLILYVSAHTIGATLAGLALRTAYGSNNYAVGGCNIDPTLIPTREALVLEFMFTFTLIFLAFGVGLDPRQASVYGNILSPWVVGIALGVLSFGSSFTRTGYGGASMNPARCFGVYIGIGFPSYHWIHWVGPITVSIVHGLVYYLVLP